MRQETLINMEDNEPIPEEQGTIHNIKLYSKKGSSLELFPRNIREDFFLENWHIYTRGVYKKRPHTSYLPRSELCLLSKSL